MVWTDTIRRFDGVYALLLLISLDRNWQHGALTEVGYRAASYRTLHGWLGAAVLTIVSGEVRVNPTIGMDVRIGGSR